MLKFGTMTQDYVLSHQKKIPMFWIWEFPLFRPLKSAIECQRVFTVQQPIQKLRKSQILNSNRFLSAGIKKIIFKLMTSFLVTSLPNFKF